VYKGFLDLLRIGFVDKIPKIIGVQAEGSSPMAEAFFKNKEEARWEKAETVADSIRVGYPRDQVKALKAVRESGGTFVTVSDEEILSSIPELARKTGVFGEPAGVTAFAGFKKLWEEGKVEEGARVVILVTGSGLKDIKSALKSVKETPVQVRNAEDVLRDLGRL
jgi:threonine synthase